MARVCYDFQRVTSFPRGIPFFVERFVCVASARSRRMKTLRRAGYRIFFCSLRIKEGAARGNRIVFLSLFRFANIFRVIPPGSRRTNTRSREKLQVRLLFFPTFNHPSRARAPLTRRPALRFVLSAFLSNRSATRKGVMIHALANTRFARVFH